MIIDGTENTSKKTDINGQSSESCYCRLEPISQGRFDMGHLACNRSDRFCDTHCRNHSTRQPFSASNDLPSDIIKKKTQSLTIQQLAFELLRVHRTPPNLTQYSGIRVFGSNPAFFIPVSVE